MSLQAPNANADRDFTYAMVPMNVSLDSNCVMANLTVVTTTTRSTAVSIKFTTVHPQLDFEYKCHQYLQLCIHKCHKYMYLQLTVQNFEKKCLKYLQLIFHTFEAKCLSTYNR